MAEETTRSERSERQARSAAFWQRTILAGRELENSQRLAAQQRPDARQGELLSEPRVVRPDQWHRPPRQ